jgi:GT2 family glycosyltransferase
MEAVVVTHNSSRDLGRFVASSPTLEALSRVVVVDNASDDDTCAIAEAAGIDVLRSPTNVGFGAAANLGLTHTSGDIVALLNPDIRVLDPSSVDRLSRHFADPRVALAAPALILPDGNFQDSARLVPTVANLIRRRFLHRRAGVVDADRPSNVAWVVGAAILVRRTAFDDISGFDPRYRVYFEDVDLCVRLRRRGWVVRFDPGVAFSHQHAGASRRSILTWGTRQHIRSACLFYARFPQYLFTASYEPGLHRDTVG